jgi:hypothetical protein
MNLDQMLPTELRRTWTPKEINEAGNSHDRSGFQFQIQMWNRNQSRANYLANHMPLGKCCCQVSNSWDYARVGPSCKDKIVSILHTNVLAAE